MLPRTPHVKPLAAASGGGGERIKDLGGLWLRGLVQLQFIKPRGSVSVFS